MKSGSGTLEGGGIRGGLRGLWKVARELPALREDARGKGALRPEITDEVRVDAEECESIDDDRERIVDLSRVEKVDDSRSFEGGTLNEEVAPLIKSGSVLACTSGEEPFVDFFFLAGDVAGDAGLFLFRLNSASSACLAFDFALFLSGLESSEMSPLSDRKDGDVDRPLSLDLPFPPRAAPFRAPIPIQELKWGAWRFDAICRLQLRHSKYTLPSLLAPPLVGPD